MIIILEGPDGSGKTTLAKAIAKTFGMEYRHEGPEPTLDSAQLLDRYLTLAKDDNIVWDRFAMSELIYAKAMHRLDRIGPDNEKQILSVMRQHTSLLRILCMPPLFACLKVYERGEDLVNADQLQAAWFGYLARTRDRSQFELLYDWTLDQSMTKIIMAIASRKA